MALDVGDDGFRPGADDLLTHEGEGGLEGHRLWQGHRQLAENGHGDGGVDDLAEQARQRQLARRRHRRHHESKTHGSRFVARRGDGHGNDSSSRRRGGRRQRQTKRSAQGLVADEDNAPTIAAASGHAGHDGQG